MNETYINTYTNQIWLPPKTLISATELLFAAYVAMLPNLTVDGKEIMAIIKKVHVLNHKCMTVIFQHDAFIYEHMQTYIMLCLLRIYIYIYIYISNNTIL